MVKDKEIRLRYKKYLEGYSLSEVGKMFGVSRQSVFDCFKKRGYKLRNQKKLEEQEFNGEKFTPQNNGYYRRSKGDRRLMHRVVWEFYNGKIPHGFDIHHKDHNRTNNKIENLELLKKDEHSRLFATGKNQFSKKVVKVE